MGEIQPEIEELFHLMHVASREFKAKGTFNSKRGKGIINYLFWRVIGIPIATENDFELSIESKGERKKWRRCFAAKKYVTNTWMEGYSFIEQRGIFSFEFLLKTSSDTIHYQFLRFKILGISLPSFMSLRIEAFSRLLDEQSWQFDVKVISPFNQLILHYWGQANCDRPLYVGLSKDYFFS